MSRIEAGFVVIGPRRQPCVAGGVVEGALILAHRLVAREAEDHVLIAVLLHLRGEDLVEGLTLAKQAEAFGLRGDVFLAVSFEVLDGRADRVALRLFVA